MLFFRIILFFTIIVILNGISFGQNINVEIEELLVLGNDENASEDYLFSFPQHICTDKKNKIYISDKNVCKIRVFDQNGKFIKSIGQNGQGPGEMLEISCFTIDQNDDLIIVDMKNMRFTRFINMGDSALCYNFSNNYYLGPSKIRSFGADGFIGYYIDNSPSYFRMRPYTESDNLFHIYNHDFSKITESIINTNEIWNFEDDPFLRTQPGRNGSVNMDIFHSIKIIISSSFYNGIFYIFEKVNNRWNKKTLRGSQIKGKSYELYDKLPKVKNIEDFPVGLFAMSGQDYRFIGRKLHSSRGVFFIKKNIIINFIARLDKNSKKNINGIEFFDKEGKYLGYGQLSNKKKKYDNLLRKFVILWKDKSDRFYISSENDEGFRIVRVLNFNYILDQSSKNSRL